MSFFEGSPINLWYVQNMIISGLDFKVYIRRCIIHIPVGIAISFVVIENSIIGILVALYFALYQINEDKNVKDFAYPDIAGAIWGMVIYVLFKVFIK